MKPDTAPRRSGRLAGALLATGLACALALPAFAASDDMRRGPLPWRVGGEVGFTVDAAAFPDSSGNVLEVYLRLAPATLMALAGGKPEGGRFNLVVTLRNEFGKVVRKIEQDFVAAGGDTSGGYGKVLIFPIRTTPGEHRLQVKMTTIRPGISKTGRKVVESVDGKLVVPVAQHGGDLSDIGFVWPSAVRGGEGGTTPAHHELLPNPERLYGLYSDSLRAQFSARSRDAARPWRWVARVFDSGSRLVSESEGEGLAGQALHVLLAADVSRQPAGGYDIEVKAWQEGDAGALSRRARFSVGWEVPTWTASPVDILDNAHFLLSRDEEEAFANMQPGEQERKLSDYWHRRDPTPDTGVNEAHQAFLKRTDFANRTYGRYGLGKGMFSDMGRVFIRYGEPSEVLKQVIPAQDNTLEQVIRQLAATDTRTMTDVSDRMIGADMRPFEVWIYEGNIPYPLDADPSTMNQPRHRNKRLVFLFVDEQWVGDYRLRYTTE